MNGPVLLPNASDEAILDTVREWCRKLSEEDYDGAFAMTEQWPNATPLEIRKVIENYGYIEPDPENGTVYRATPVETATFRPDDRRNDPTLSVTRYDQVGANRSIGYVLFDLPLNGFWSDVTASFDIVRRSGGLVLQLGSIRIM